MTHRVHLVLDIETKQGASLDPAVVSAARDDVVRAFARAPYVRQVAIVSSAIVAPDDDLDEFLDDIA